LAVAGYSGTVTLWDAETGTEVLRLPGLGEGRPEGPGHPAPGAFSGVGRWLTANDWEGGLIVGGPATGPKSARPGWRRGAAARGSAWHARGLDDALATPSERAFHFDRLSRQDPPGAWYRLVRANAAARTGGWEQARADLAAVVEEHGAPSDW